MSPPRAGISLLPVLELASVVSSSALLTSYSDSLKITLDSTTVSFLLASAYMLLAPSRKLPPLFQELAWGVVLQSGLILSILQSGNEDGDTPISELLNASALRSMAISFVFGGMGSFLGGILAGRSGRMERFAVGALVASYIGGTANFFETTKFAPVGTDTSVFASIAAVDIGVMCVYFAALSGLLRLTTRRPKMKRGLSTADPATAIAAAPSTGDRDLGVDRHREGRPGAVYSLVSVMSAVAITSAARLIQNKVGLQGLSVTLATVLAFLLRRICASSPLLLPLLYAAGRPAAIAMSIFYASIGMSCTLVEVSAAGSSILATVFTLLSMHLLFTFAGTVVVSRQKGRRGRLGAVDDHGDDAALDIDMDVVVLASNAAVGGSATAAAMATAIGRADLVLPASLCGVLGYIVGTPVGRLVASLVQ